MNFPLVPVNGFTPNNSGWSTVGTIDNWSVDPSGLRFTFTFGPRSLVLSVLGPQAFRVRFNPAPGTDYGLESSVAVVSRDLGLKGLKVVSSQPQANLLEIDTGTIRIQVGLAPFEVAVYRGTQLIHQDHPGQGVLYIPGAEVVAVMKTSAPGAGYVGCGEKAGSQLLKNGFTFTFFNFDNYTYTGPSLGTAGPLNPTEPLYCSIPLLIESNPFPTGAFSGEAYACGVFLDNTAQTFVNVSANDYSDMSGKYYLGALYNDLDYYFLCGNDVPGVMNQYTSLTGRPPMPPRYVFGYHQGAYGYFDHFKLAATAAAYRSANIPCDGLHIDVDFQDNYRTFTHSEVKFPNCAQFFSTLHLQGFKMSTNITPILSDIQLDETGAANPFTQRQNLLNAGALIFNTHSGEGPSPTLYEGGVNYGNNFGSNPYKDAYPPLTINRYGMIPLTAPGNYPDFGLEQNRKVWGQQYQHLIANLNLDMIWQDMTCPAIDPNRSSDNKTFPGDLMMARESVDQKGQVHVDFLPNAKLHNSYVLNLLKATYEGVNDLRPAQRNFIIARGGYAGMQRYGGLWTGDSASSWDFLRINLPEVLNLGLSGVPISGCDIGGFAKGPEDYLETTSPGTGLSGTPFQSAVVTGAITNYELLTRWMHLGSLLPWYRNHYDGYNKGFQEPYAYGEPVPTNCRKYVELRYRMLQVYYDAMYECTQTGMPVARALFLNDPKDQGVYQHLDDQFFIGRDFLVAPILDPHESIYPPSAPIRSIYLPTGSDWYAFMDNAAPLSGAVHGGTTINNYYAGLDLVPIYVRAGAILPFCELEQWVGQLPANPLTLNCYPGPDRWTDAEAYLLYQDDGISTAAADANIYRTSRIYQQTLNQGANVTRVVRIARVHDQYTPAAGFIYVAILGSITMPGAVMRDGAQLPDAGESGALAKSPVDAWYWNPTIQITFAKVFDNLADTTLTFNF